MANNFKIWWEFCQESRFDGGAENRWGWTLPTWRDARKWFGLAVEDPSLFESMTQGQAEFLARGYFWYRLKCDAIESGPDISCCDWWWNAGNAAIRVVQYRLAIARPYVIVDGIVGPVTIGAIKKYGAAKFVRDIREWRDDFNDAHGFQDIYPGLYVRSAACEVKSAVAITESGDGTDTGERKGPNNQGSGLTS